MGEPGWSDPSRRQRHIYAAARAQIENRLALSQLGHRDRVPATQTGSDRGSGQVAGVARSIQRRTEPVIDGKWATTGSCQKP
jgi:hypothetical protein